MSKQLSISQQTALRLMKEKADIQANFANRLINDYYALIRSVMEEIGIPIADLAKWQISDDFTSVIPLPVAEQP